MAGSIVDESSTSPNRCANAPPLPNTEEDVDDVFFYLPDFFYLYKTNTALIQLVKTNPEFFKFKFNIGAIYGCFPNQIWNGGRSVRGNDVGVYNILDTIKKVNDVFKTPIRFTYTNPLITEEHLDDPFCNFVTEAANNGMNEILVNSPILEEYLRKKYPNFKYISSATRCIRDVDKINELTASGQYHLVLGDYRDNFNFDFLSKIQDKDKIEILTDPACCQDCVRRELHYKLLAQMQLGQQTETDFSCEWENADWVKIRDSGNIIKAEDLCKYISMGFKHFKLEGRNKHPSTVIESYLYYFVKPEFVEQLRLFLLREQF